jgi:acetylglutamate kinase
MREAGLKPQFVSGLRVTDEVAIAIVENTLDKEINPKIVDTIVRFGGKAQGISGKSVFIARRLPPQRRDDGDQVDVGFVGEATKINIRAVRTAIRDEIVPVISPIGAAEDGLVLNINADVAAGALASALKAAKLIYVSDVPGIMRDPASSDSLIPTVHSSQIDPLIKDKVIDGGMIPKVQSAADALKNGVEKIHMIGGNIQHCMLLEIFTNSGIGTEIVS